MVRPLFIFAPVIVAGAIAWPMAASKAGASATTSPASGLTTVLDEALQRAVPGAEANGLVVSSLEVQPLGIGDWQQVSGSAQVGEGATAAAYRFSGRVDPRGEVVTGLRVRASANVPTTLAGEGHAVIEAAIGRELAAEFPDQSPRFTLVSVSRMPDVRSGERVFQGRGLIDFGDQGEVLAPIEVRFDADARITALRYSLDELDPTPFDDATAEPAADVDAMIATR